MHPDLLIPLASLPEFDATGLRVVVLGAPAMMAQGEPPPKRMHPAERRDAVVLPDGQLFAWEIGVIVQGRVQLDFSDASTRDRATRWAAAHSMPPEDLQYIAECGCFWFGSPFAPRWRLGSWFSLSNWVFVPHAALIPRVGRSGRHPDEDPEGDAPDPRCIAVPALDGLDYANDDRLGDGSRLVDALALTHTCIFLGDR